MTDRVIDISETAVRLSVRNEQLRIEPAGGEAVSVPLCDLAVLIAAHPQVSYTQAVLAGLAEYGGVLVACDRRQMPAAMMLPLEGHSTQAERFAKQAAASLPTRKRLWRGIVRAKIAAQARVLVKLRGDDGGLPALAARVRSGDPENLEARASRRYWPLLFNDRSFRRRREAEDQNRNLNYGYAVVRAIVSRALTSAGLHPSFGLHHHNRYNAFALADDLMEPYRPIVDLSVAHSLEEWGPQGEFRKADKAELLDALTARFEFEGEARTLFDWMARSASSLVGVLTGERKDLFLAEL